MSCCSVNCYRVCNCPCPVVHHRNTNIPCGRCYGRFAASCCLCGVHLCQSYCSNIGCEPKDSKWTKHHEPMFKCLGCAGNMAMSMFIFMTWLMWFMAALFLWLPSLFCMPCGNHIHIQDKHAKRCFTHDEVDAFQKESSCYLCCRYNDKDKFPDEHGEAMKEGGGGGDGSGGDQQQQQQQQGQQGQQQGQQQQQQAYQQQQQQQQPYQQQQAYPPQQHAMQQPYPQQQQQYYPPPQGYAPPPQQAAHYPPPQGYAAAPGQQPAYPPNVSQYPPPAAQYPPPNAATLPPPPPQ